MRRPHHLVLSTGGLRSLVAATLARHDEPSPRLTLLHIADGRENLSPRRHHLRLQAEWLECKTVTELPLPHLFPKHGERTEGGQPIGTLVLPQLLLIGLAHARSIQAQSVIYPGCVNQDPTALAVAAEQLQLCEHLAGTATAPMPTLEAPLLELSDAQVIELGGQLGVPWHAAWSCQANSNVPCQACIPCHRRRKAFEAAKLIDTQRTAVAAR